MKKVYASTCNTEYSFEGELFSASPEQMNISDNLFVAVEDTDKQIVMLEDKDGLQAGHVYTVSRVGDNNLIVNNGDNEITVPLESAYLLNPQILSSTAFIVYDGSDGWNHHALVFGVTTSLAEAKLIQEKHSHAMISEIPFNTNYSMAL